MTTLLSRRTQRTVVERILRGVADWTAGTDVFFFMSAIVDYTVVQQKGANITRVHKMKRHIEGILWAVSFLSLIVAAMTTQRVFLLIVAFVWVLSTVIAIPLHFVRAWRRWPEVPNKRQYAVWVGFETFAAMALIGLFVYWVISR
jgi:hypothetical protein